MKYLKTVTKANGSRYTYYSEPGRDRIRLPDLPHNHPKFIAAYAAAQQDVMTAPRRIRAETGTLAAMIEAYKASDTFLALRQSTRGVRRNQLDKLAQTYGTAKASDLRTRHIQTDINKIPGHAANNRLKVWRALCRWAAQAGLLVEDPAIAVRKKPMPKSAGHIPWSAEEIETFREFWKIGTPERLAFELIYWTGARVSDAARLSSGMVDAQGWITFKQTKTGGEVSIPWSRDLPSWADPIRSDLSLLKAALDARNEKHLTFITTKFGKARSIKSFSQWFSGAATKANLPIDRSAHGLRKSRAVSLAELGATTHQIAAWTGHESLSEVERYSKAAQSKRLLSRTNGKQKLETGAIQFPKTPASN